MEASKERKHCSGFVFISHRLNLSRERALKGDQVAPTSTQRQVNECQD